MTDWQGALGAPLVRGDKGNDCLAHTAFVFVRGLVRLELLQDVLAIHGCSKALTAYKTSPGSSRQMARISISLATFLSPVLGWRANGKDVVSVYQWFEA